MKGLVGHEVTQAVFSFGLFRFLNVGCRLAACNFNLQALPCPGVCRNAPLFGTGGTWLGPDLRVKLRKARPFWPECMVAEVWSWGRNKSGQLGVGDYRPQSPRASHERRVGDRDRIHPVKVCGGLVGTCGGVWDGILRSFEAIRPSPTTRRSRDSSGLLADSQIFAIAHPWSLAAQAGC